MEPKYLQSENYKIGWTIYNLLKTQTIQNTVFAGNTEFIRSLIEDVWGPTINETKDSHGKYFVNTYYTWIDCHHYSKSKLVSLLKQLSETYNFYKQSYQFIILHNLESIPTFYQQPLKTILETRIETSRFLILTNNLQSISPSLQSVCSLILLKKEHLQIQTPVLKEVTHKLMRLWKQPFTYENLKKQIELCHWIMSLNLPISELLIVWISELSKAYPTSTMIDVSQLLAKSETDIKDTYRQGMYLENVCINIHKILQ